MLTVLFPSLECSSFRLLPGFFLSFQSVQQFFINALVAPLAVLDFEKSNQNRTKPLPGCWLGANDI